MFGGPRGAQRDSPQLSVARETWSASPIDEALRVSWRLRYVEAALATPAARHEDHHGWPASDDLDFDHGSEAQRLRAREPGFFEAATFVTFRDGFEFFAFFVFVFGEFLFATGLFAAEFEGRRFSVDWFNRAKRRALDRDFDDGARDPRVLSPA